MSLQNLVERDPRYMVIDHSSVDVAVQPSNNAIDAEIDAVLIDISNGGARLRTNQQVPQGQQLTLKLSSDQISGSVLVDAKVCWIQLSGQGEWFFGCAFQPPIPQLVLDQLSQSGVLDRREDQRTDVSITSTAAWQLATDVQSVCIVNISSCGFCLISQQPGKPGNKVLLKFTDGDIQDTVTGRCRWQVETDSGFTLGCEFSGPEDYQVLRRIQIQHDARLSSEKRGLFRRLLGG